MPLETATYVDSLITSNPDGTDQRSTADDHLRLIKACLKRTFPLIGGAVSASSVAISYVNDLSASVQAQLNALRQGPATANFAVQASSASFAIRASGADSASFATLAGFAQSASFALFSGVSTSSSYATNAGHAISASFATQANNALSLGGIPAASYARTDVNQAWTKGQAVTQANTSGTTLTPDAAASCMFRHTMTAAAAHTIAAPTTPRSGQVISIHLINGGSSTATWNAIYKFAGGTDPTLTSTAGHVDVFAFQYDVTSNMWRQAGIDVS